eukprot:gnl/TRDRNA2_/TRDRNA2_125359_c1_seq2.p1 gnl/TRDRNA2_/TRDRNA2_125359_c1~~gnl/TRDRNA2_/TRDRNA2_125359_c1_seq2.p1  ORF type:complete len:145 (-),score=31.78 gnl/TRDRNA2_/TRDRNA2_125359_c1_seq2:112-546(-)
MRFSEAQVDQLRDTFAGLTATGTIGAMEVMLVLRRINPDADFAVCDVEDLIGLAEKELAEAAAGSEQDEDLLAARLEGPTAMIASRSRNRSPKRKPSKVHTDWEFSHERSHIEGSPRSEHKIIQVGKHTLRFDGYLRLMGIILR